MILINEFLSEIMKQCYMICGNYGLAIVLFTFITKIVLLPVTVWTYFNSIKMIRMQPVINELHVKYYGQKDVITDEEAKLYKEQKYHPLASSVPLIIQVILLVAVINVIKAGIGTPGMDMQFGPVNLGMIPARNGIKLLYAPVCAGLSSLLLSVTQNSDNILQAEQSKWNKYGTMLLSVGLSLYLGWFVPVGTAWYWVLGNLMSIVIMYCMNAIIRPRRYVDYERLENSRRKLDELKSVGKKQRESYFSENRRRERADYKRFFSVTNKHLVFYSESGGFYKYYKGFIEYLLMYTNVTIHYITSDPDDRVFSMAEEQKNLRAYYIGENRLITLMMKMDADVVAMTMPDLEQFHIKRSYVKKNIEYIYIQHGIGSVNLLLRKGALDYYDTVFVCNDTQRDEVRETERVYGLPEKKIIEVGYPLMDEMHAGYKKQDNRSEAEQMIMIAPSWQNDNIVDSCLETILDELANGPYKIIVRPHPQEVRLKRNYIDSLIKRYDGSGIEFQTDFSSNTAVTDADVLITDWSDIGFEFALTTYKPVLYINTPMKVMNPDWRDISVTPLNLAVRDQIGISLDTDRLSEIKTCIDTLISEKEKYYDIIKKIASGMYYNQGRSAEIGAQYIIQAIQRKIDEKKRRETQ